MNIAEVMANDAQALAKAREAGCPLVIRGLTNDWPAVQAAQIGPLALAKHLSDMDAGTPVERMRGGPEINGRFFYQPDLRGLNFTREPTTISAMIRDLLAVADQCTAPALYMGAAPTADCLPAFTSTNPTPNIPKEAFARVWLGNAVTIQTHFDASENLACVVGGTRTFTLFPPDQTPNLYVGPLEFTPAGQPLSMVCLDRPDFERFPRFAQAQAAAVSSTLKPGDAIYIPPLWWHHVRSHGPFNVLVNYWWESMPLAASAFEALIHAVMTIRPLPDATRAAWRELFDAVVFGPDASATPHIPAHAAGVLGPLTLETAQMMRHFLIGSLSRR